MRNSIADMLTRIKNAYLARLKTVKVSYSKTSQSLGKLLVRSGYLTKVEKVSGGKQLAFLEIGLRFVGKKPAVNGIKIVSKPSLRVYVPSKKIRKVLGGRGILIVSTPKGLMTGEEARKKNLGGEIICEVW